MLGGPSPTPAPAADTAAPVVSAAATAPKLAALVKSGFPVKVGCSEGCSVTIIATVDKATAKKLKLGKQLEVARVTRKLAEGAVTTLPVQLSAKAKKAIKKLKSVKIKLTIVAVDAAGNRKESTKSVTVRK